MRVHFIRPARASTPFELFALAANPAADVYEIVVSEVSVPGDASARAIPTPIGLACELAQQRWQSRLRIIELADHVKLSVYHFTRLFGESIGVSPYQYLDQLRIAHACEMLAAGVSATTTAYDCGFGDQSHLTKRFKRMLAVTPGEFARDISVRADQSSLVATPAPFRMRRAGVGKRDQRVELAFVATRVDAHQTEPALFGARMLDRGDPRGS